MSACIIIDDGPCAGTWLTASQAPIMLRVTRAQDDRVDCLDQATDIPRPDERVVVYRARGRASVAFVDGRDPKTGKRNGYQSRMQHYVLHDPQPEPEHLHTWAAWSAWCEANKAHLMDLFNASCGAKS